MIICIHCGAQLPRSGALVCPNCGRLLFAPPPPEPPKPPNPEPQPKPDNPDAG